MKKIQSLALALFATFSLASCSNDEPAGGQDISNGEPRYLSVQITPTSAEGSKAVSDPTSVNGGFEYGTGKENEVKKVRFYFFTDGGDAAKVCYNGTTHVSYYDWDNEITSKPSTGTTPGNVEMTLNPVIVIDTPKGDKLPGQIVAVINPDETNLGDTEYNLTNLRLKYEDYAKLANEGTFVMANSVYVEGNEVIKSTKLKVTDFKTTRDDATAAPVKIYVERNVAKIRARYNENLKFTNNLLPALDKTSKEQITIHGETEDIPVFIKVEGWNVTYTMPAANLSKHINLSWNDNMLGSGITWKGSYRTYWADENKIGGATHQLIPWNSAKALNFTTGVTYANENAERTNAKLEPTNIIVAATLCKADGTALNVCDYSGLKFADDDNFSALKGMILTYMNNGATTYYKKVVTTEGETTVTTYKKIEAADITFKQSTEAATDKYTVYAVLTETAQGYVWVTAASDADEITDKDQVTESSSTAVNAALKAQRTALIYKDGMSYYFAPIKHYTLDGIVRNHIYSITVDGFYGMGTPVYDPTWSIILEKPSSNDSFLAAEINILSWHLINNNITFD